MPRPHRHSSLQTDLQSKHHHLYKLQHQTSIEKITNIATVTAATITTTILSSPLAAIAEDDSYEYGAVAAPGGLGLAAGLGVLAILTAAVPVVLAPGEDAFNEMRDRDNFDEKRGR